MSSTKVNHINSEILNKFQSHSNNTQHSQLQLLDKIWVIKNLIKELHVLFSDLSDNDMETVHYNVVKLNEKIHALQDSISKTAVHNIKDIISVKITSSSNEESETDDTPTDNNVVILKLLNKEYLKYRELLDQYILNRLDDLIIVRKNDDKKEETIEIINCREIFEFIQNMQNNDKFEKLISEKFRSFFDFLFNANGQLVYNLIFEDFLDLNKISLIKEQPIKEQHNLDVISHYNLIRFNLYLPAFLRSIFKDSINLRKKMQNFIDIKLHSINENMQISNSLLNLIEICLVLNYLSKTQFNFLKLSNKISVHSSHTQLDEFFFNNLNDWSFDNFNILKIENLYTKSHNKIKSYLAQFDSYDMIFDDLKEIENIDLDTLQPENVSLTKPTSNSPDYLSAKSSITSSTNSNTATSNRNRNMKLPPLQINQLANMLKETDIDKNDVSKQDRSFNKSALDALTGTSAAAVTDGPLSPVTPTSPFMASKALQLNTTKSKLSANNEMKRISKKFTSSIKSPIANEFLANSSGSGDSDSSKSTTNGAASGNSGSSIDSNAVFGNTNGGTPPPTALSRRASKRISRRLSLRFSSSVKSPISESFDSSSNSIHSFLDHPNTSTSGTKLHTIEKPQESKVDEIEEDDDLNLDDDGWGTMDDDLDIEEVPVFSKSAPPTNKISFPMATSVDEVKPGKEESTFNSIDEELDDWGWGDDDDLNDLEEEELNQDNHSDNIKTEEPFVLSDIPENYKCTAIPETICEIVIQFVKDIYQYDCLNSFEMAELIIQLVDVFYIIGGYSKYESKFLFYNDIYYLNMEIRKFLITKNIKINYAYNTKIENYLTNTINLEKIQFLKIYKKFNNFNHLVNHTNNNEIIHDKNISILNQLEFKFKEFFFSGGFQELLPSLKNIIIINFLNEFYQLIINDILELKLISELASIELDKVISKMLSLLDIFSDEKLIKYLKSKIFNFNKLKNFQLIVKSHLSSIMESFYNGEFYNVETNELINLINALFIDSDIRRNAIKEIVEIRSIDI